MQWPEFIQQHPMVLIPSAVVAILVFQIDKELRKQSGRQAKWARLGLVLDWLCTGLAASAAILGALIADKDQNNGVIVGGMLAGLAALVWFLGKALRFILAGARAEATQTLDTLALQVMRKWGETAVRVIQSIETQTAQQLVGKAETMSDFWFVYEGLPAPAVVTVSVKGVGDYLGFWGSLMNDGTPMVGFGKSARPGAKKLVRAIIDRYPQVRDGNRA